VAQLPPPHDLRATSYEQRATTSYLYLNSLSPLSGDVIIPREVAESKTERMDDVIIGLYYELPPDVGDEARRHSGSFLPPKFFSSALHKGGRHHHTQ